jgi:hypothetical protein
MIKRGISRTFLFGNVTNRGKMFKPSILQINQINIIIFHQGYNLANIPKLEKLVSDPYLLYLANKNMFKLKKRIVYFLQRKPNSATSGAGIAYPSGPPNLKII